MRSDPQAPSSSRLATAGSISFVVYTENGADHADEVLDVIAAARSEADEVILLTRSDQTRKMRGPDRPWLRIVGIPHADPFMLRSHIPAVAEKEWIVVLEEHSIVTVATMAAIREVIENDPGLELIAFLGVNTRSTTSWGWANFLHTFGLIWAPIDHPPPFSAVTSAIVKRSSLGTEAPLREGEWELKVIPAIFSRGKVSYSNAIVIDHYKPLNAVSCLLLNFHNARAGAAMQRRLGADRRVIVAEGLYNYRLRPYEIAAALRSRQDTLPAGFRRQMRCIGFVFWLGMVTGAYFGPGNSPHKLD
jgi:hypothetical protein